MTHSTCPECRKLVPAKIQSEDNAVYFLKFCSEHGESRALVRTNLDDYIKTLRYVKPAWTPMEFSGDSSLSCPEGCGFCSRHEQHLCMPIVEITSRCDLECPICIVSAGRNWDMQLDEFKTILSKLVKSELQIDVLNISGGEPLLHPQILDFIDNALSHPEIIRVSISTNGLPLLENEHLLSELLKRNVVISLQFDGFDDDAYEILRGRHLLKEKLSIMDMLERSGISTSLTMTVAKGVNDKQLRPVLDRLFSTGNFISLMLQPIAFAGRAANLRELERLTIPELTCLLGKSGHPAVSEKDFFPLPCSHPLCFSLSFYLMLEDSSAVSVGQLVDANTLLDSLANRVIFGLDRSEHEKIKDLIYDLWSGPSGTAPDSQKVLKTLKGILKEMSSCSFDPKKAFEQAERRIKSIFIHAFQDADTFDLSRVRRCCQGYPQADGKLIPACVNNVFRRSRK
ncbi:MAG: radical SAM protein [Victivallales bacterium]